MAFPIMILFAQEVLLLNAIEFGFLAYGAAIGGILGSLIANKIYSTIGESNGISLCVFLFALGGLIIYFTSSPLISAFAFSLMSFGAVMWNVIAVSIRQELVPNKLLGRVNSVYRLLALGATPLGALMSGTLVKFSENFISRESALRVPFLILGLAMMMLFILSFYLLSQKLIDNTRKKSKNKS
jgi:MFS family permease